MSTMTEADLYMKEVIIPNIYHVAFNIVAMVIVAIGILGNVLNLVVLTRPKLKGVMYVYLLGLAVSNLSVLITAIPALMSIAKSPEPIYSSLYAIAFFFAHLEIPLLNAFMAASVYIIIGMTVNRYISIYKPTHFQRIHTFKNAYLAIAASFIFGSVLHVPLAFQDYVYETCANEDGTSPTCPSPTLNDTRKYNISNEMDDPGGGTQIALHTCIDKTYVVCANVSYTSSIIFSIYTYCSESLLRFGPIITLTILNILIIARFNRIVRRREVLKGNTTMTSASGKKRKITASSTSGTTSSGNNNTASCRNNSNVYSGLSPNGDCPDMKKVMNGENGGRENSLIPPSPKAVDRQSNGRPSNTPSYRRTSSIKDDDTATCFGCISNRCTDKNEDEKASNNHNGHPSPYRDERKLRKDGEGQKSSSQYLMTPELPIAGSNNHRGANMVTNDNVSSSFCNIDLDTRTNSTALTTVSEVTAMTYSSNCNGENASELATPLMTPRTPLQNRRSSSRANSKTHSLNGNGSLLAPGNAEGSSSNLRGPHRVSSRRRGLHSPEERMLVVVLIAIVVLFVICTTPAAILSILFMKDASHFRTSLGYAIFRAMANCFELLGFALNFFVYCLCSADIRRAFVDVLFENCVVAFIKNHILSRVMYPLRRGSPAGSNQSFEVEVRPVADQVNHQPSLAILGEVSENPEPEADQNGSAVHDRSDRKGRSVSIGDVTINGVAHSGPSISTSPNKSNQNISATTKNTNAINSVVTLVKEEKCNGDDDRKVSIPSAENV